MAPTSTYIARSEPSHCHKPQPIGNIPFLALFTVCALCVLFLLFRKAQSLRKIVGHSLKSLPIRNQSGQIRLSEDDGPPHQSFIADDDLEMDDSDEPLPHYQLGGQYLETVSTDRPRESS